MKIEYIRNMQFGYMKIVLSEPLSKTEEEMLSHNTIEGMLPVRWQQENDRYLLRYDITGKQALDALMENGMADEKLLKCLLVGICVAMKQLEKHLLPQEGLLLSPETIFWDYKTETMHFCYYPEVKESLQDRFVRLMEYMLAKTDHKNIMAVQLAYGVYEEVLKPSFCMSDLQEYLYKQSNPEKVLAGEYVMPETDNEPIDNTAGLQREGPMPKAMLRNEWKAGVVTQIMAWIKDKLKKYPKEKVIEKTIVWSPEEEPVTQEPGTTVLEAPKNEIEGVLRYEGRNSLPDIFVSQVPFTIGSAGNCNGIIKHPNISRYHAKITCRDGAYFIEDLNSTNGTKVNGGLLSYKTKVSLSKNVSIHFANEPYRFM